MSLKDIFDAIAKKTSEMDKQKAGITRKLEANKGEKARAEAAKAAALEAKDEKAYKEACRAIADADAGIEFNTICMDEYQKKQQATEAEDAQIRRGLQQGLKEIYVDAFFQIERLATEIQGVSESALQKMKGIDAMADSWNREVMKQPNSVSFCSTNIVAMQGIYNSAKARLEQMKAMKKADPFFKEGGK